MRHALASGTRRAGMRDVLSPIFSWQFLEQTRSHSALSSSDAFFCAASASAARWRSSSSFFDSLQEKV